MDYFDDDDIVISGIGGCFPESDNFDELQDNLLSGYDMVTTENSRWPPGYLGVPVRTGKMKSINKCDAQYFGIMRKQCKAMDTVTRQVLERAYEAMLDAGLNPADLRGSNTGVFFGSSISETEALLVLCKASDGYFIMGRNRALNANRLSYWLDLKGTSIAFDNTWTNGLHGFELAYTHIRNGLCDAAIVSCGNNIHHANVSKNFQDLNVLSPDGTTRAFDNNANGYARSEAVAVFVIQKAKDAKRIYGSIVHVLSKTINNSIRQVLAPKQEEWKILLDEFYEQCKVDPNEVTFLEADGTALKSADVEEMNAAAEIFCSKRDSRKPLLIGSVKSNLGHAEASAGLCSVAKVLVATHTGKIPPNLHYRSPNTKISALLTGKMKVVTEPTAFEGDLLAINSFGLGGTYAHLLIKRPSYSKRPTEIVEVPRIVLMSGRSEEGVEKVLNRIESTPLNDEFIRLVNDVFSKGVMKHAHRGFTIMPQQENKIRGNQAYPGAKRPVWFVFSGMGSQWLTMAKDLMPLPIFRESIEFCHNILVSKGLDLKHIVTQNDSTTFDNILHCFVGIAAVQIALIDVLKALKIEPDGMIGHSVGEIAAAYADGCLTREQMILSAYSRGKASIETPLIKGMMAAIGKGYNQMKDHLPDGIEVACHNAADSCTLSGPAEKVNEYVDKLKADGVFARAVNVANIAYHSQHITPIAPKLFQYLTKEIPQPKERSPKWISTSVPEQKWDEPDAKFCSARYLTNNLLSPVYFEEGCRHIPPDAILIEIAPHGLLQAILKRSMGPKVTNIPLTNRNAPNQLNFLLQAIGNLYVVGLQPQVKALYPQVNFPVSPDTPTLAPLATWDHSEMWDRDLADYSENASSREFEIELHQEENVICKTYKFDGKTILPYSQYLMLIWETYATMVGKKLKEVEVMFEDVIFKKSFEIKKDPVVRLYVTVSTATGAFEILRDDDVLVTGYVMEGKLPKTNKELYTDFEEDSVVTEREDFYTELLQAGHEYIDPMVAVKKVKNFVKNSVWINEIEWTCNFVVFLESIIQTLLMKASESNGLHYLTRIRKLTIDPAQLPKQNAEVDVVFELTKDVLFGDGVYGFGFNFKKISRSPLKLSDSDLNFVAPAIPTSNNFIKISHIEIFGKDIEPPQLGYCGKSPLGQKIIGLGSADEVSLTIKPDEILSWSIPEKWSPEEAATVPIAYSLAYYVIKILGNLRNEDTILIVDGAKTLGLACLSVALESENVIYTAVFSEEEKEMLLQKFAKLKRDNVFVSDIDNMFQFIDDFMIKTKSLGVDFIVSAAVENIIEKLLYCINPFGKLVKFFTEQCEEGERLQGTINFAKHTAFYAINLASVLNLHPDEKKLVKNYLLQGIQSNTVVPFPKTIVTQRNEISSDKTAKIFQLDISDDLRRSKPKRYICEPEKSCLIVGGETHTWMQISEWFIKRQAKQITVINTQNNLSNHYLHKLKQLNKLSKVIVKCVQSYDQQTLKTILKETGSVSLAILLPVERNGQNLDSSYELLKSFDSVCQDKNCYTISVLKSDSKGVKICNDRNKNGFSTLAVLWDSHINGKTQGFLQILDTLLYQNNKSIIKIKDENEEKNALVYNKDELKKSLPKCPIELADYSNSLPEEVRITELRTWSPALKYIKETLPFFIIPGICKADRLIQRFQKSLYPAFIVNVPHLGSSSMEEYGAYVVPKLKNTTPGPYILIGDNWGGSVALELARQLESLGERVHVFLLSGTPFEVLEAIKPIGEDPKSLEMGLMKRTFEMNNIEALEELLNEESWFNKLNVCTSFVNPDLRKKVFKGLDAIKCRLENLMSYSISHPLNGPLTIITKTNIPLWHTKQLSKEVKIVLVEPEEDILNDKIFTMIHDSSICKVLER